MQDPRFREYGFDHFFLEANRRLPQHPKPNDVLSSSNLTNDVVEVILGTAMFGHGLQIGVDGLDVSFGNLRDGYGIQLGMQIGDDVKQRLAKGHTDDQIRHYLNVVRASGIEKAKSFTPTQSRLTI